jgi:hypothetical protein
MEADGGVVISLNGKTSNVALKWRLCADYDHGPDDDRMQDAGCLRFRLRYLTEITFVSSLHRCADDTQLKTAQW